MALTPRHGLCRFMQMPFRLQTKSGTSRRIVVVVLFTIKWQFALEFHEDFVLFVRTPEGHIDCVRHVLILLYSARVVIKLKKRKFITETFDYFGHVIWP